jgi:UDP-N-acetylmuramoyl-tripeptide--D-alanyl-D-alanine ligase
MPTSLQPTRETLLAILQQSEYDFVYFDRWVAAHRADDQPVKAKNWTPKLKLIAALSKGLFFLPLITQIKLASLLVQPAERLARQVMYARARRRLAGAKRRGLIIIALAGSYGKTSTKKIADHVLSQFQTTLSTPKSINTPLGIADFVLKQLTSQHKFFLVEMGEYYPGDITTLCEFIQPDFGVVTPLGRQHLERMGNLQTIAKTILELAEYLKKQQKTNQVLIHESLQGFVTNPADWQWYGQSKNCDWQLTQGQVTRAGTEGEVVTQNTQIKAFTPLFGIHQLVNSLPSLWLTHQLKLDTATALRQLSTTPPVPHRHQPIFVENNVLILDNGYNSNPDSAAASLKLLTSLPASHRIVITPGFVELGTDSQLAHEAFGKQLAKTADYLGILQSADSQAIERGWLSAGGDRDRIVLAKNQDEAVAKLKPFIIPDSVILFENNVPEVYT